MGRVFTVKAEENRQLPEDSIHTARLVELSERTITWQRDGQQRSAEMLDWWWEITATDFGDQYVGRRVRGSCDAELTTNSNNRFRVWAEALLGREIPFGHGVDIDDLVGLSASILIGHRRDKRDPSRIFEEVVGVMSQSDGSASDDPWGPSASGNPPF